MKNRLLLFIFISTTLLSFSQSRIKHDKLDSLQFYSSERSVYEFSMHSKLQGFFWDSIFYDSKPSIEVKIVNDSKDTLINYYQCRDSRIYWMEKRGKYGDTLLPGQSISVKSMWPDREPTGTFDSPIRLKYKIGDSIYINRIEVWGSVYPMSDKIISKSIAISQQITFEKNNLEPDRSMELEILDKNEKPVIDAQLSVNGFTAVYNTEKGKYELRYRDERTYHLKISRPDYLPVNCEGLLSFPSRLYLLKEGEFYRFESGLKYPVIDYSKFLYVTRKAGRTPKADSIIAINFERMLDSLQLVVHFPMDSFIKRKEPPFHQAPGEHLKRSYIITKKNGDFQMNGKRCTELESLQNSPDIVEYAGPLVSNRADFSDATFYTGQIGIHLKWGENWEEIKPELESLGFANVQPSISDRVSFYLNIHGLLLKDVNTLLEAIHALKGVEGVGALSVWFFTFHD